MYLAMKREPDGSITFFLRESYRAEDGSWRCRNLMELGQDPEEYIVYLDGMGFYISPVVEEALEAKGVDYEYDELEEVFWPFLDADIRQRIDNFGGRTGHFHPRKEKISRQVRRKMQEGIHDFDRRRMLFMKFLSSNLERLMDEPMPFLDQILDKSRDEIEHLIESMEFELRPWELRTYLYTIFRLPDRFPGRLTRFMPEAQSQEAIDHYFLEELCRLNEDASYIDAGSMPERGPGLHPYLKRYLFLFFDTAFRQPVHGMGRGTGAGTYYEAPPSAGPERSEGVYLKELDLTLEEFNQMSEQEFIRHFRRMAQTRHPDKGGDHDAFIRLQESFKALLIKKRL